MNVSPSCVRQVCIHRRRITNTPHKTHSFKQPASQPLTFLPSAGLSVNAFSERRADNRPHAAQVRTHKSSHPPSQPHSQSEPLAHTYTRDDRSFVLPPPSPPLCLSLPSRAQPGRQADRQTNRRAGGHNAGDDEHGPPCAAVQGVEWMRVKEIESAAPSCVAFARAESAAPPSPASPHTQACTPCMPCCSIMNAVRLTTHRTVDHTVPPPAPQPFLPHVDRPLCVCRSTCCRQMDGWMDGLSACLPDCLKVYLRRAGQARRGRTGHCVWRDTHRTAHTTRETHRR